MGKITDLFEWLEKLVAEADRGAICTARKLLLLTRELIQACQVGSDLIKTDVEKGTTIITEALAQFDAEIGIYDTELEKILDFLAPYCKEHESFLCDVGVAKKSACIL